MTKRLLLVLVTFLMTVVLFGAQVAAQQPEVHIHIAVGYNKGHNNYNIVVQEQAGTKLELYTNDKSPVRANANKNNWATFHGVKLIGSGKISFTKSLSGKNRTTWQKPINYARHFTISDGHVTFSSIEQAKPKPKVNTSPVPSPPQVTPTPVPVSTPAPSSPTPVSCSPLTNGGNCYNAGEYCRNSDHGIAGIAGNGEAIICADNDGWRWEPR
jgi:hypothetical protein